MRKLILAFLASTGFCIALIIGSASAFSIHVTKGMTGQYDSGATAPLTAG